MSEQTETAPGELPPEELPFEGEAREFWREMARTLIRESITSVDETAKQVVTAAGVLAGLYFNAIAFGDLRGAVKGFGELWPYLLPIVFLLGSLFFALFVFLPSSYRVNLHSSHGARQVYERVVRRKLLHLRLAAAFLLLGVAALGWALYTYLTCLPPKAP